ncbi:MAG: ABC transporter ATP-binding protein [Candidatus Thorarchaeota archaeon]
MEILNGSIITVDNLYKTYPNGVEAVRGISLDINHGEIFSLLGPNGAGKSTTINMIVGLLEPTSGTVSIYGEKIKARSKIVKEKVGVIPQELIMWELLTVEENMHFLANIYGVPKEIAEKRIDHLINRIHLEEKRKELVKNLSGGLKRRLQIIMSLVHDPEIILCDEPTPGLDPQSRLLVWEFLEKLCKDEKKTIILTTHFMDEADHLSDRVAIMDYGKLLVMNTTDALKNSLGKGDILEFKTNSPEMNETIKKAINNFDNTIDVIFVGEIIIIRGLALVQKIPSILNQVENLGLIISDMKIRKTTLEDVFIDLTGRQLRDE